MLCDFTLYSLEFFIAFHYITQYMIIDILWVNLFTYLYLFPKTCHDLCNSLIYRLILLYNLII